MVFRKAAPPPTAQPLPFQPWATPPLGSLGDAWDEHMELPKDASTAAREDQERKAAEAAAAKRKRKVAPIQPIRQQLHRAVIAAWVLNAMALTSVGAPPITLMRQPLALLAFLSAAVGIWMIKKVTILERGIPHAIGAMVVAAVLFAAGFVD